MLLIVVIGVSAVARSRATADSASASSTFAVYLELADAPVPLQADISLVELNRQDVSVVRSVEAFQSAVAADRPRSICINAAALPSVPSDWLRNQVTQGIVVVTINTTNNTTKQDLASALGVDAGVGAEWGHPSKSTFVIYYRIVDTVYTNSAGGPASFGGEGWFNDSYDARDPSGLLMFVREAIRSVREASPGAAPTSPTSPVS